MSQIEENKENKENTDNKENTGQKRGCYLPKESCINCQISLEMAKDFVASSLKRGLYELRFYEKLSAANRETLGLDSCESSEERLLFIIGMLAELSQAYPKAQGNEILYIDVDSICPSNPIWM